MAPRRPSTSSGQRPNPNWALVASGAAATLLSFTLCRRKSSNSASVQQAAEPILACDGTAAASSQGEEEGDVDGTSSKQVAVHSRDAVRKLRQQLKCRDEMVMEMRKRLVEKETAILSHRAFVKSLEEQLKVAADMAVAEAGSVAQVLDKANEAIGSCCNNCEDLEQGSEGELQLVLCKAKHLEAELVGIRAMACEMASLLEGSELERLRLQHVVSQLQMKLVYQAKELHTMKALCTQGVTDKFVDEPAAKFQLLEADKDDEASSKLVDPPRESLRLDESSSLEKMIPAGLSDCQESFVTGEADVQKLEEEEDEEEVIRGRKELALDGSPGVVIGSPTISGSRSIEAGGGRPRYLLRDDDEESSLEEMLDDTLDDLVKRVV